MIRRNELQTLLKVNLSSNKSLNPIEVNINPSEKSSWGTNQRYNNTIESSYHRDLREAHKLIEIKCPCDSTITKSLNPVIWEQQNI